MPEASPEERLRELKRRRESLIASKATLDEKQRQNEATHTGITEKLKQFGLTESTLDSDILKREQKLSEDLEKFEKAVSSEEQKVALINQGLVKVKEEA